MKTMVLHTNILTGHIDKIRHLAPDWQIVHSGQAPIDAAVLARAEIIIGWNQSVRSAVLADRSALRWLHVWGAGVNTLPLARLQERGIILTNSSGVHAFPISETILMLMLALTRRLHLNVRNQTQRQWKPYRGLQEINGKTMGLIGIGAIGEQTARLARSFGMTILGCRRSPEPSDLVDVLYSPADLALMVGQSDYVVNTLPLTAETKHLINRDLFAAMKPGSYYINIGRGGTTDTAALIDALRAGRLSGAGLDVFEEEPLPPDSPLWDMPEVIISPHQSGQTEHYNDRAMEIFLSNLADYLAGRLPQQNRVDLQRGY
jgi:phosphoglycerate dehydrogenase-like enzyme